MKRVSRWLAGICMAAVLFGAAGLEAVPVRAAGPALEITAPDNKVQTYQCGQAQDFVLNIKNTSGDKLTNITVSPKLKDQGAEWPFKINYQSYHETIESLDDNTEGTVKFNFMQKDNAGEECYPMLAT